MTHELMSRNDSVPTLLALAGEPDIIGKCHRGFEADGRSYKVHLDGHDRSRSLTTAEGSAAHPNAARSARDKFF